MSSAAQDEDTPSRRKSKKQGGKSRIGGKKGDGSGEKHLCLQKRPREKGEGILQLLKDGMKQDRFCACLEEQELDVILASMEHYEFCQGDLIIEEGKMGNTFFVTEAGTIQVSVSGNVVNTMGPGATFGGLSLLYHGPRTATVVALEDCHIWGANGDTFQAVLQENSMKHYAENRKFLDSIGILDCLTPEQKARAGEACMPVLCEKGSRVFTEGEPASSIYFVKKGQLEVLVGGSVQANGTLVNGTAISQLLPGDCFGERAILRSEPRTATVIAQESCELLTINIDDLKDVLGDNMATYLERNFILLGLKKTPIYSQFSSSQQSEIVKAMLTKDYQPDANIEDGFLFAIVIDGSITGFNKESPVTLVRGQFYQDGSILESDGDRNLYRQPAKALAAMEKERVAFCKGVAGKGTGARLAALTSTGFASVMKELNLSEGSIAEETSDYTRKKLVTRKVHVFRHLSHEQIDKLAKSFVSRRYGQGVVVIREGEVGTAFFVIASGEVSVSIRGEKKRVQGKNSYIGERALLFDEPRTATVEVASSDAELWSVDKSTFLDIVKGNMHQELMLRIGLQDADVTLKDLKHIRVIGTGAAGVVRLVEHKKTGMRYALKRVLKQDGAIPEEVRRECELLGENDHPFIVTLVKTFESPRSVYMLQEVLSGGELHDAIRRIPTVLSRSQGQFYTGSLVLILQELSDREIVYRDLKPENVMLDKQGYLKLIDFGIAKKLSEGESRTFTMVGTPHYMAPEVMRGHGYGTEVDLWSLGIMLFEFVCGYLPFADDLDDPTEVCRAVLKEPLQIGKRYKDKNGSALIQGLLTRQPKKRLGAGINGYEDVRNMEFFKVGHVDGSLFDKIMGRELDPPVVPPGEVYGESEEVQEAEARGGWSDAE